MKRLMIAICLVGVTYIIIFILSLNIGRVYGKIELIYEQAQKIDEQTLRIERQNEIIVKTLYGEKYSQEDIEALFKKN